MAVHELREGFQGVPGDGLAVVDREVPDRFDEVALAGPAGPQMQSVSCRSIHSRVLSAFWVAAGNAEALGPTRRRSCRPAARRTAAASMWSRGHGRRLPR